MRQGHLPLTRGCLQECLEVRLAGGGVRPSSSCLLNKGSMQAGRARSNPVTHGRSRSSGTTIADSTGRLPKFPDAPLPSCDTDLLLSVQICWLAAERSSNGLAEHTLFSRPASPARHDGDASRRAHRRLHHRETPRWACSACGVTECHDNSTSPFLSSYCPGGTWRVTTSTCV